MILLSDMVHQITVYSRTIGQGPDNEPVPSFTPIAKVRGLANPKAGQLLQDTVERRTQLFQVYSMVNRAIRAGLWIKVEAKSIRGPQTILTGQILEVNNPNFADDHLELRVQAGGDPINV